MYSTYSTATVRSAILAATLVLGLPSASWAGSPRTVLPTVTTPLQRNVPVQVVVGGETRLLVSECGGAPFCALESVGEIHRVRNWTAILSPRACDCRDTVQLRLECWGRCP